MPDSAAKRSNMLPMAPMPFWHIVKCISVYKIKILCDEGFFGGGVVCHLFHPWRVCTPDPVSEQVKKTPAF